MSPAIGGGGGIPDLILCLTRGLLPWPPARLVILHRNVLRSFLGLFPVLRVTLRPLPLRRELSPYWNLSETPTHGRSRRRVGLALPVRVLSDTEHDGSSAGVFEPVTCGGRRARGTTWPPPASAVNSVRAARTRLFPFPSLPYPRRPARCLGPEREPCWTSVLFCDDRR